jgi:probable F420-dependent oxidoreductase
MHIGIFSFNTEYTISAVRLAKAVEERGFESLWMPEHTNIPVPADGSDVAADPAGGVLPREYRHMSDPFCALSAAAAVTERIKLGTSVCLINQHHPINLAKQVSTLDQISGGRFIFGVGAGWNRGEMGHHGVRFEDRWPQVMERIEALKTIWGEERPQFHGKFVEFDAMWQYPKPVQKPHPPIVLGTLDTPFGRSQVARHGDGWFPLTFDVTRTRKSIDDVHARMRAVGRDPSSLEVSLFFLEDKLQPLKALKQARETGAARSIMRLPVADEATVIRALDHYAELQRELG